MFVVAESNVGICGFPTFFCGVAFVRSLCVLGVGVGGVVVCCSFWSFVDHSKSSVEKRKSVKRVIWKDRVDRGLPGGNELRERDLVAEVGVLTRRSSRKNLAMMNDEEDSDFKMDGKRSTVAVNASRHSAIRDEDSETDDQVGNGHQSEPDEDELGKLPADVRSSQEKENGQLGYSKRGRRLRRVSLNEEELFDEEFDEEDENVTVKRRRNSSSQRRRRFDFATKSESRDSSRTPKSPVYTRSGRLTRQNSRYDDDSNEDDIRGVDRERGALDAHLEEEEFDDEGSVRRSTRLRRADRSVYHDPSEEEVDVVPARKRPSAARKEGVAVKQEVCNRGSWEPRPGEKRESGRKCRKNVLPTTIHFPPHDFLILLRESGRNDEAT